MDRADPVQGEEYPLNRNPKSWVSHITLSGVKRPSKIALLNSLDYDLALILRITQKAQKAQEKSMF